MAIPKFPRIERKTFNPRPCSFDQLAFVGDVKTGPRKKHRSFWVTPEVACWATANAMGGEYAADFAQYLKQNKCWVGSGTLGRIAEEMYSPESIKKASGIPIGFWSLVEQLVYYAATHLDVYAMAEKNAEELKSFAKSSNDLEAI